MRALRLAILALIALLPAPLKPAVYRWLFGYRISGSARIGLALLDCDDLEIGEGVRIGHLTVITRCRLVKIEAHAFIGALNIIRGGQEVRIGAYAQVLRQNVINAIPDNDCVGNPQSVFVLEHGAVVTAEHRIDFTDRVELGRCSMLAGRNSSIWTHNRRRARPVRIGAYCYLGSEIRIAPGVQVADCCLVTMGSVVTSSIEIPFVVAGGFPVRILRAVRADDEDTLFGKTRPDLPDESYPKIPGAPAKQGDA